MQLTHVDFEHHGDIAIICLNNPDSGNTLSKKMALDLLSAAQAAEKDDSIRAVVFSARGPMFSFGGNLKEFKTSGTNPQDLIRIPPIAGMMHKIVSSICLNRSLSASTEWRRVVVFQ